VPLTFPFGHLFVHRLETVDLGSSTDRVRVVVERVLAVPHEMIPPLVLVVKRKVGLGDLLAGGLRQSARASRKRMYVFKPWCPIEPDPTHLLGDVAVLPRKVGEEQLSRLAEQIHLDLLLPAELDKIGRVHAEDGARVVEVGAVVLDEWSGEVAPGIEGTPPAGGAGSGEGR
jgi:hypothetical protein